MNRSEALSILELNDSATDDEIRTAFRKKAAKMHPDINKEENAEQKYKEISEAYEYLKAGKQDIPTMNQRTYSDLEDFFRRTSPFGFRGNVQNHYAHNFSRAWKAAPATTQITISFIESILGCARKINLTRYKDCPACSGSGKKITDKKCSACNGEGSKTNKSIQMGGVFIMKTICNTCQGSGKELEDCIVCNKKGCEQENVELNIQVPPGIRNHSTVRLRSGGNIYGQIREDALIDVIVTPEENMKLIDNDVVSNINISLYNALKGCDIGVKTVLGDTTIKIPERSKNNEEVVLDGYGVASRGKHRFILNVEYPNDINHLLEALENKKE